MRAITLWRKLDSLARHYEIPLKAKVVIRRPYCIEEPVESVRQRKDGTIVISTKSRW